MSYRMIIVGCGGTGANFIVQLGRYLYRNSLTSSCSLLLVDGDIVESDNISRQPFSPSDVGRKKGRSNVRDSYGGFWSKKQIFPRVSGKPFRA